MTTNYLVKPITVRYPLVTLGHERPGQGGMVPQWPAWGSGAVDRSETSMTYNAAVRPTFSQLIQSVNASVRAAFKGALPSSHKNLLTRLRKAVIVLGHTLESEAALMLGASVLDQNVARLREHQFGSAHERNDIVSAVRRWSCWAAERYPTPAEGKPERLIKQKTLATLLKRAYARQNLSHRELVREARIPLSSFERWLRGRLPDERSIEGLLRLAAILNLDSHQVLGCISHRHVRPVPKVDTPYGAYLRERRKPENRYLLSRRDINAQLAEQWYDYVRCQTTAIPVEKRPTNRGWRIRSNITEQERRRWFALTDDGYSPTAEIHWRRICSYLSFVANVGPRCEDACRNGGLTSTRIPRGTGAVQTLAWLAIPEFLESYLKWHKACAGRYNSGARAICSIAHSLCAHDTGWLRRRPQLAHTLPEDVRPANWSASCDSVLQYTSRMTEKDKGGGTRELSPTRNPFDEGLSYYLGQEDAMEPILRAIRHLHLEADALDRNSTTRAVRIRDAAILALLLMLPVRLTTAASLEWNKHLRLHNSELCVQIPAELLKNGAVMGPLNTTLGGELVPVFMRYVNEARPLLQRGSKTTYLFLSERGNHTAPWKGVSLRCVEVTTRFCEGFAIPEHSIRHLVATRYLKLNPSDYVGLSALLWDTLQTILRHYAPRDPTGAVARNANSIKLRKPGAR